MPSSPRKLKKKQKKHMKQFHMQNSRQYRILIPERRETNMVISIHRAFLTEGNIWTAA